jgi:hypothetical protein
MQSSLITYAIYQVLLFDIYEVIIRLLRRKFNINVKNEVNGGGSSTVERVEAML